MNPFHIEDANADETDGRPTSSPIRRAIYHSPTLARRDAMCVRMYVCMSKCVSISLTARHTYTHYHCSIPADEEVVLAGAPSYRTLSFITLSPQHVFRKGNACRPEHCSQRQRLVVHRRIFECRDVAPFAGSRRRRCKVSMCGDMFPSTSKIVSNDSLQCRSADSAYSTSAVGLTGPPGSGKQWLLWFTDGCEGVG